jgi:hypothetical protein
VAHLFLFDDPTVTVEGLGERRMDGRQRGEALSAATRGRFAPRGLLPPEAAPDLRIGIGRADYQRVSAQRVIEGSLSILTYGSEYVATFAPFAVEDSPPGQPLSLENEAGSSDSFSRSGFGTFGPGPSWTIFGTPPGVPAARVADGRPASKLIL